MSEDEPFTGKIHFCQACDKRRLAGIDLEPGKNHETAKNKIQN